MKIRETHMIYGRTGRAEMLTISRAGFSDYEDLTLIFSQCNAEHLALRQDLYRRVKEPVPKLKYMLGVAAGKVGIEPVTILMANQNGSNVGAVYVESNARSKLSWSAFEKEAVVDNVVVIPNCRRLGIASKLLEAAKNWAIETGHAHISAKIVGNNQPSLALFEKAGFGQDFAHVGLHLKK